MAVVDNTAKYEAVKLWLDTLEAGTKVTITNIKTQAKTTSKKTVTEIKNKLIKGDYLIKKENGSSCYYHTPKEI